MIKEAQEHQQEARYNLDRSTEKFILKFNQFSVLRNRSIQI